MISALAAAKSTPTSQSFTFKDDTISLNNKQIKMRKILKENEDFGKAKESDIIRDLVYVLQGINGTYIKYSFTDDCYNVQLSVNI